MKLFLISLMATWIVATRTLGACSGDCGGDGEVTVDELIVGVNIALGIAALSQCTSLDASGDGEVTVDELIGAVNQALNGCTQSVAGDYSGSVTLEPDRYAIVNLNINSSNQATGSVVLTTSPPRRASAAL